MYHLLRLWKKYSFLLLISYLLLSLFDLRFAILAIICMVAPIIVSLFHGRFWCGNLCPRGSFYDTIVSKFSKKKRTPKFLKSIPFRIFMVFFICTMFLFGIYSNWGNPYGIGMVFYRIIAVTTLLGITLSMFYNHRTWCSFCPMGTIATGISKLRKSKKVLHITENCVTCKLCEKNCPFGIKLYEFKDSSLNNPNCLHCGKCTNTCPKKAIGYRNKK